MVDERPQQETELIIAGADGLSLSARLWRIEGPRGVVLIAHGLGEHGGAYDHVAKALGRMADVDVVAVDFRGHGRSPGRRGVVGHYDELRDDLRAAVSWASTHRPGLPRFALGHSNGGLVVLRAIIDGGLDVSGVILSNPALRVAAPIPRWKLCIGQWLRRHAPGLTMTTRIDPSSLTRDPEILALRQNDPLRHDRVNGPLFFGIVEGGLSIAKHAAEIRLPLLLILGEADPIIDPGYTRTIFEAIGSADKTLIAFPGMLHEPFNDLGRDQVLRALCEWLGERLPHHA